MKSMYIGSGDISALLAGKETKAHQKLLMRFVSNEMPNYNALASPIDALRTGAILEDRYFLTLPENYFPQYKVVSSEMNVIRATLDFAVIEKGRVVDFEELKSIYVNDFIIISQYAKKPYEVYISEIKRLYNSYYNQVQAQLYCSGLSWATLTFLCVYDYVDDINYSRCIQPNEVCKFTIYRDESVINRIKERAEIFQKIKDYYAENDSIP